MEKQSQLFLSLVRVSHDGIMLSVDEEVVFKNNQVTKTFDLNCQVLGSNSINEEEVKDLEKET